VYIKTDGDKTVIICNTEKQMEQVMDRMSSNHIFIEYEEWDEDEDKKFIVTFLLEQKTELN
jgi:Rad3-related DNA helicase